MLRSVSGDRVAIEIRNREGKEGELLGFMKLTTTRFMSGWHPLRGDISGQRENIMRRSNWIGVSSVAEGTVTFPNDPESSAELETTA